MLNFLAVLLVIKITSVSSNCPSQIFNIEWSNSSGPNDRNDLEKFNVTSSMGEKYTCFISRIEPKELVEDYLYQGPFAIDFVEHLFNKEICSYRLDPFWTYEVCHGRHIRQYHEVLDGTTLKLQQFTLGKIGAKEREMIITQKRKEETIYSQNSMFQIPTKKVENKELPYVEISMNDGSICENNRRKLRKSNVYYMCDMNANHDIHSVKEITSCVYEIIILTPLLCAHKKYRPKMNPISPITCYAIGKSPRIPFNLAKIYWERRKIINKAAKREKRIELLTYDKKFDKKIDISSSVITNFLNGKDCISGGTGGFKYEFCYGKYINQYTYGVLGLKTTVCFGKFNLKNHLEWIRNNPHKRPKLGKHRTYITQLYTDGTVSNMTGKPRQTEVRLKCLENSNGKNDLVMYLYETNSGEYTLGIESTILCEVVLMADEDGLVFLKT